MEFKIVTPNGIIYEDTIERVTIPTKAGVVGILENHIPMVSILKAGEMTILKNGTTHALSISTGMLEVRPTGEVYVIADSAERAEHIDIERAEAAKARAEELLKQQQNLADVDFVRLQAKIEKELARISVGRKYRNI